MVASETPPAGRRASALLLAASLAIGLAQVCVLPPGEGFDEPAHLSYIQQIADTGRWPRPGDPLSAEIEHHVRLAPTPYASTPPYDRNDGWTYRGFFRTPAETIASGERAIHAARDAARRWQPGTGANWEAQHPPLYYAVLAPLFAATRSWSLADQLLVLRGVSYGFAWVGLLLAVLCGGTTARAMRRDRDERLVAAMTVAPALWPFLFPAWFPSMARLGNDSLVVPIVVGVWLALLRVARSGRARDHATLGAACGLGLLTKATLVPLVAAVVAFAAVVAWRERRDPALGRRRLVGPGVLVAVVVAVAGWWYVVKLFETGNLLGSYDMTVAARSDGWLAALSKPGSVWLLARGGLNIATTFIWSGTWSYVEPRPFMLLPFAIVGGLLVGGYVAFVRSAPMRPAAYFPGATLALYAVSLGAFVVVLIAAHGSVGTPGWYLHSLVAVLAPIVAMGLAGAARSTVPLRVVKVLMAYPLLFIPAMAGLEVLTFSGCGGKSARRVGFAFEPLDTCLASGQTLAGNLAVLGSPGAAAALFAVGLVLMAAGLVVFVRHGPQAA